MHAAADFAEEKHELEAVLASGIFNRAPNLAQVLTYVCTQYFEGSADQIKEYNIAVEALGRPPHFDQKRDSIVRVEAHRLRKRLREYYEAEGSGHKVRIEITPGQYAPKFLRQDCPNGLTVPPALVAEEPVGLPIPASETQEIVPLMTPVQLPSPVPPAEGRAANRFVTFLAVAVMAVSTAAAIVWRFPVRTTARSVTPTAPIAMSNGTEVRILAGLENGT